MKIDFTNRVAVITGAGKGLGRTYALEIAKRGGKVVVNDSGVADGVYLSDAVAREIQAAGGEAAASHHNVAELAAANDIIQTAMNHYGKIDILINNAGILRDRSFINMSIEEIDQVLKVHLYGAFYCTKAAFPIMKQNKYGRILMVSSAAGIWGNFGQANYSAAKMAMVGFMNAIKAEAKRSNIIVNTLVPMAFTTLGGHTWPMAIRDKIKLDYVTAMVTYLVSEANVKEGYSIHAGGGYYAADQIFRTKGYHFSEDSVTAEMIAGKYDEITDYTGMRSFYSAKEANDDVYSIIAVPST